MTLGRIYVLHLYRVVLLYTIGACPVTTGSIVATNYFRRTKPANMYWGTVQYCTERYDVVEASTVVQMSLNYTSKYASVCFPVDCPRLILVSAFRLRSQLDYYVLVVTSLVL